MARVISSGLGHISGRIGDHIFYAVGDKRYVRRAPVKVSNPRSPAQCLQRWRRHRCKHWAGRSRGLYFSVLPTRLLSGWENDRDTIFF